MTAFSGRRPKGEAAPIVTRAVFLSHLFRFPWHFSPVDRIELKFGTRKLGTICSPGAKNLLNRKLTSQLISFQRLAPCCNIGGKFLQVLKSRLRKLSKRNLARLPYGVPSFPAKP